MYLSDFNAKAVSETVPGPPTPQATMTSLSLLQEDGGRLVLESQITANRIANGRNLNASLTLSKHCASSRTSDDRNSAKLPYLRMGLVNY